MNLKQLIFFIAFLGFSHFLNARIIYVNLNATGSNTGEDWTNAYSNLATALENSVAGDSLWVTRNTYYPTDNEDRFISFELPTGVAMFGGFSGTETRFTQRSLVAGKTILDGQLSETANSFTILHLINPSSQNIIDGFDFKNGIGTLQTEETSDSQLKEYAGGAILIESTDSSIHKNILIKNCSFKDNIASSGSAIHSEAVDDEISFKIDSCIFDNSNSIGTNISVFHNVRKEFPIEIYNSRFENGNSEPELSRSWPIFHTGYGLTTSFYLTVERCQFNNNYGLYTSAFRFSLFHSQEGTIKINDCIFNNNRSSDHATVIGGILRNTDLHISNCTFNNSTARYRTDYNPTEEFRPRGVLSVHKVNGGNGKLTVENSQFINNHSGFGGAINIAANATISNCLFQNNTGIEAGGAINIEQSYADSVIFNNCTFLNNWSAKRGSFIQSTEESDSTRTTLQFNNCIIQHAADYLGNLKGVDVAFNHSILSTPLRADLFSEEDTTNNNYNVVYDEATLGNTILEFADTLNHDLRLKNCSVGIDAGSATFINSATDITGNPRLLGNAVDIGAYENTGLVVNTQITPVSCDGVNDGQVVFDIQNANGSPSIAYNATVITRTTIEDLAAGVYEFTIRDTTTCAKTITVNIPNGNLALVADVNPISCPLGNDGAITIKPTNGFAPYRFRWDTGDTLSSINNLTEGVYAVTVTDNNNCERQFMDTLYSPLAFDVMGEIVNATTNNSNDGSIQLTQITGGTPPYQIEWNTGSMDSTLTALSANDYVVTIIDAEGCTYREGFTVSFMTNTEEVDDLNTMVILSPNPVTDILNVELVDNDKSDFQLRVLNAAGQIISIMENQNELDVQSFPAGIYFLKVITFDHIITKSFVKQ